jgi:hypothetical protein
VRLSPRSIRFAVAALVALPAMPAFASAQAPGQIRSNTRGLMLGGHVNGSSLTFEDEDTESGAGAGFRAGWGFTPKLALFVNVDAAKLAL